MTFSVTFRKRQSQEFVKYVSHNKTDVIISQMWIIIGATILSNNTKLLHL